MEILKRKGITPEALATPHLTYSPYLQKDTSANFKPRADNLLLSSKNEEVTNNTTTTLSKTINLYTK